MENWRLRNIKADINKLSSDLSISPIISKIMVNRGIKDLDKAKMFLDDDLEKLRNPRKLKDLEKGVSIIKDGILNKSSILLVGDYDCDGILGSFTLLSGLKRCGANVTYHIPDRITEGYGINESIIMNAHKNNVDIIITVDNGIAAYEQIKLAKELGIKVVVTDHHDVPFKETDNGSKDYILPPADAIINPKQIDCEYPFDKICGATVGFKFIQVLYEEMNIDVKEANELIQFIAIATVCDVVDLVDENRIIVKEGLKQINKTSNLGLKALLNETNLLDKQVNVYSLGFIIGPCLNAAGRLEHAGLGLELLLSDDSKTTKELASKLYNLNLERQDLTKNGLDEALNEIIKYDMLSNNKILVVYLPDIHESIAGIIAGRIKEKFNLPSIVLTKAHDGAKGSARSIEEYNIFEGLLDCKDLLDKFGGHPMAAGLSLPIDNIDSFRKLINDNCTLSDEDVIPKVFIDIALPLKYISYDLINELSILEPFGKGNSRPLFGAKNISISKASILGKNQNVLKLQLVEYTNNGNIKMDGIYFGDIDKFKENIANKYGIEEYNNIMLGKLNNVKVDLVYYPEINEFRGNSNLQIIINNLRV